MKLYSLSRHLVLLVLLLSYAASKAQDTSTIKYKPRLLTLNDVAGDGYGYKIDGSYPLGLYHHIDSADAAWLEQNQQLLTHRPDSSNYIDYHRAARLLWEAGRQHEAEKLFLHIVNSKEAYYTGTYRQQSDIPGDTTTNSYGYGSYTFNYKNSACIYLAKIYIEQKECSKAYQYLEYATKKYKTVYTCGTGNLLQQNEYKFLYVRCFEAMNAYRKVLDLLLPNCLGLTDEALVLSVKKLYTPAQIKKELQRAERSLSVTVDTVLQKSYANTYEGGTLVRTDSSFYYNSSATMQLFGKIIQLYAAIPEYNTNAARKQFLKEYKTSFFYTKLAIEN